MEKEYTLKFNPQAGTWESVRVQAALQIGAGKTEEYFVLSPEFKVEDAPNIKAGFRGGIKSGLLEVTGKKLVDMGKWAEFYIRLVDPKTAADRRRMALIMENQMDYALKVTLNPLTAFLPGVPIDVIHAMADHSAEIITVYIEAPLDRMKLDPDENPLQIATNAESAVPFVAVLEKMDYETMSYIPATDEQGKIILPNVDTHSTTGKEHLVAIKKESDEKGVRLAITPSRFIVGDGTPVESTSLYVRSPKSFNHIVPDQVKIPVLCTTNSVEADVRVQQGNQELCRKTVTFSGEQISVEIRSDNENMDWKGVDLVWQVTSPSRFYTKSHQDWGRMSLAESQQVSIVLVKGDAPLTQDTLSISIEESIASGTLQISKCGWSMIDSSLDDLFPNTGESISERMRGAVLEVTCEAAFEPQRGELRVLLENVPILDATGILTWDGKKIVGESAGDKLIFKPDGERIPGKVASLHLKLVPEDIIRDHLEEIGHRAGLVDESLTNAVSTFAKGELTFLAREKNVVLSNALQDIYGKLLATETFFGKVHILQKDLDIAFDLRAKAASQILNNIIGVLVEFASVYIQSKANQGTLLNADTGGAQAKVKWAYQLEQIAKGKVNEFATEVKGLEKTMAALENALAKANGELDALSIKSADLIKKTTITGASPAQTMELAKANTAIQAALQRRNQIFEQFSEQKHLKGYATNQIDALNKGIVKKGAALTEALKGLQTEVGALQVGGKEGLEEAAKKLFAQDHELLTQIFKERRQGKNEDFLQPLYGVFDDSEGGPASLTPSIVDILLDEQAYDQFVDRTMASLSQVLDSFWGLLERIPTALSAIFRDYSWVDAVVSEPYRTKYAEYKGTTLKVIPTRLPPQGQNLITGQFAVDLVKAGQKPDKEWIERAKGIWLEADYKERKEFRSLVQHLGRDLLSRTVDEDRWMDVSPEAFEKASNASDRLISLIKAYDVSFDNEKKWTMADNPSWQNVDNIINEVAFYASWSLRILSWASMATGILAPVALGLSKAGDIVDISGAMLQTGISYALTMPEINGIVEAVPLLTAMMHEADMGSEVIYDGNIIDF